MNENLNKLQFSEPGTIFWGGPGYEQPNWRDEEFDDDTSDDDDPEPVDPKLLKEMLGFDPDELDEGDEDDDDESDDEDDDESSEDIRRKRYREKISRFVHAGDADDCGHERPGSRGGKFTEGNTCAGEGGSRESEKRKKMYSVIEEIPKEEMKKKFDKHLLPGKFEFNPRKKAFVKAINEGLLDDKKYVKVIVPIKDMDISVEHDPKDTRYARTYSDQNVDMGASFVFFNEDRKYDSDLPLYVLDGNHRAGQRKDVGKTSSPVFMTNEQYNDYMNFVKDKKRQSGSHEETGDYHVEKHLDEIYAKAPHAKNEIDSLADHIARDVDHGSHVVKADLKGKKRALKKIKDDYSSPEFPDGDASKIKDIARNTILAKRMTHKEIYDLLTKQGAQVKIIDHESNPLGYSGINAFIKTRAGITAEIQVNSAGMIYAKEVPEVAKAILGEDRYQKIIHKTGVPSGLGHKYYEQWRELAPDDPERVHIEEKSKAYYSHIRSRVE